MNINRFIENNEGTNQVKQVITKNLFWYNHWNDWISPDSNGNGIVDFFYQISGDTVNRDPFPVISPLQELPKPTTPTITDLGTLGGDRSYWNRLIISYTRRNGRFDIR